MPLKSEEYGYLIPMLQVRPGYESRMGRSNNKNDKNTSNTSQNNCL
jgi:hypothetical protein